MKLSRLAFVLPAVAGLAAAAGLTAASMTANASPAPHKTPAARIAVYDCANKPQVRPSQFDMFCDGSAALSKLSWSSWTTTDATGTGVFYVNNCVPNCAAGKWSHSSVIVVLWRPEPVAHHPGQYGYSKVTFLTPATGKTATMTPPGAF